MGEFDVPVVGEGEDAEEEAPDVEAGETLSLGLADGVGEFGLMLF